MPAMTLIRCRAMARSEAGGIGVMVLSSHGAGDHAEQSTACGASSIRSPRPGQSAGAGRHVCRVSIAMTAREFGACRAGAAVETEPADPQKGRCRSPRGKDHKARGFLRAVALAPADHRRRHERPASYRR